MKILLARDEIKGEAVKITYKELKDQIDESKFFTVYLDRENSHKDMLALVEKIEKDGRSVKFSDVRYGLMDDDYIYELQVI